MHAYLGEKPSPYSVYNIRCMEIFARRKFLPINFAIYSHWQNFCHTNFLSCVNEYMYIEDMATFTTLVKIYSTKYFCNTKVSGVGEIFVK